MTKPAGSSRSEASGRPFTFSPDNRRKLLALFGTAFDQALPRGEEQRTRLLKIATCADVLTMPQATPGPRDFLPELQRRAAARHARQGQREAASMDELRRDACERAVGLLEGEVANYEGCLIARRGGGGGGLEFRRLRSLMGWLPAAADAAEKLSLSLRRGETPYTGWTPLTEIYAALMKANAPFPNDGRPVGDSSVGFLDFLTWYRYTHHMADTLRKFAADVQRTYRTGGRPSNEAYVELAAVVLRVMRCCEVGAARNDRLFARVLRVVLDELIGRHPEIEPEIPQDLAHVQRQARRRWAPTAAATAGKAPRRVGAAARRASGPALKKPPRES